MYRPTMNLNRAFKEGGEVIEAYTLEGQKEGRKRFEEALKRDGYASVEDWEKALRTEPLLDLLFYAMSLEEELAAGAVKPLTPISVLKKALTVWPQHTRLATAFE